MANSKYSDGRLRNPTRNAHSRLYMDRPPIGTRAYDLLVLDRDIEGDRAMRAALARAAERLGVRHPFRSPKKS